MPTVKAKDRLVLHCSGCGLRLLRCVPLGVWVFNGREFVDLCSLRCLEACVRRGTLIDGGRFTVLTHPPID